MNGNLSCIIRVDGVSNVGDWMLMVDIFDIRIM